MIRKYFIILKETNMLLDEIMLANAKSKTLDTVNLLKQQAEFGVNNEFINKAIDIQEDLLKSLTNYLDNSDYCKVRSLQDQCYALIKERAKEAQEGMDPSESFVDDQIKEMGETILGNKNSVFYRTKVIYDPDIEITGDTEKDKAELQKHATEACSNYSRMYNTDTHTGYEQDCAEAKVLRIGGILEQLP